MQICDLISWYILVCLEDALKSIFIMENEMSAWLKTDCELHIRKIEIILNVSAI